MSRLYGVRANRPTRVDCELIESQNAMIRSLIEQGGSYRAVGWGIGRFSEGEPSITREAMPKIESQDERAEAARKPGEIGISWLETDDDAEEERRDAPQPFLAENQLFAHHGEIEAFDAIRARMVEAVGEEFLEDIEAAGDSAHLFQLIRSLRRSEASLPGNEVLRRSMHRVIEWSAQLDPGSDLTANLIWTDGSELLGVRFGHPLWVVQRSGPRACPVHGGEHHTDVGDDFRAAVVASKPLTEDEEWTPVPDQSIVRISPEGEVEVEVL